MTFPETAERSNNSNKGKMKTMDVTKVFRDTVKQAARQDRVTTGLYNCAKLLQTRTDRVVMCILPREVPSDDLQHMQYVLIEAHCREHRIYIVKVNSEKKLENLLVTSYDNNKADDIDVSCVLIEKPRKDDRDDPGLRMLCKHLSQERRTPVLDIHE